MKIAIKKFSRTLVASVGFLALSITLPAAAETQPSLCSAQSSAIDITRQRDKLSTRLKVAIFHADVKDMVSAFSEQTRFLDACKKDSPARPNWQFCDSACYRERANYYYFLASDLAIMSAKSAGGPVTSPADSLKFANSGLEVMELAKAQLLAESRVEEDSDAQANAEKDTFASYLRKYQSLALLEVRLHLLIGDSHYQAASADVGTKLDSMVGAFVASELSTSDTNCSSRLCAARIRYQKAQWVLIEAKGSLPDLGFEDELNQLSALQNDLKIRMDSINQGKLFIGIEPYGFSSIPKQDLLKILEILLGKIASVEERIEQSVKDWQSIKATQDNQIIDEKRYLSGEDVNLKLYQIARIDQNAKLLADDVTKQIEALGVGEKDFNAREQLRKVQFEIQQKVKESAFSQTQILKRQNQEILAIQMEQAVEQRNELRWLINLETSLNSLNNQILSLEGQKIEYEQRLKLARKKIEATENSQKANANEQTSLEKQIESLEADKDVLKIQKTDLYSLKRQEKLLTICQIERDLAFLGNEQDYPKFIPNRNSTAENPSEDSLCQLFQVAAGRSLGAFKDQICDLRASFQQLQVNNSLRVRKCFLGFPNPPTVGSNAGLGQLDQKAINESYAATTCSLNAKELDLASKLQANSKQLIEARKAEIKQSIFKVNRILSNFIIEKSRRTRSIDKLTTEISTLSVTASAAAYIPDANAATGPVTSNREAAKALLDAASIYLTTVESGEQQKFQLASQIEEIEKQAANLQKSLEQVDIEAVAAELQAQQTMTQILKSEASLYFDVQSAAIQGTLQNVECESDQDTLKNQADKLITEHRKLLLTLDVDSQENKNVDVAIARIDSEIEVLRYRQQNLALDDKNLAIDIDSQKEEISAVERLIKLVVLQISGIEATLNSIRGWESDARSLTKQIADNFKEKFQQVKDLAAESIAHLEDILAGEKSEAAVSVAQLDDLLKNNIAEQKTLIAISRAQQSKANEEILKLRKEVLDSAGLQAAIDSERPAAETRFLAADEVLASLTRGLPDFISQKKNYLSTVNYVLGHMKSRAQTTGFIAGSDHSDLPLYVSNSSDLESLISRYCQVGSDSNVLCVPTPDSVFFDREKTIITYPSELVIPANSSLLRALNRGEAVDFDISAAVRSVEDMKARNYLSLGIGLGDSVLSRRNMYLMDIKIGGRLYCPNFELAAEAGRKPATFVELQHSGIGYVLDEEDKSQFVLGQSRSQVLFVSDYDNDSDKQALENSMRSWKKTWNEVTLPEVDFTSDTKSSLPFLGAPAYGRYTMKMQTGGCQLEQLRLNFVVTKPN